MNDFTDAFVETDDLNTLVGILGDQDAQMAANTGTLRMLVEEVQE